MVERIKVIETLVCACPNLKKEIDEYYNDFSEYHLHLIFGDVFNPYFLNLLEDIQINNIQLLKISHLLEMMAKSCEYVQEVVVTTVLERLADDPLKLNQFKLFAGKTTLKFIQKIEGLQ